MMHVQITNNDEVVFWVRALKNRKVITKMDKDVNMAARGVVRGTDNGWTTERNTDPNKFESGGGNFR